MTAVAMPPIKKPSMTMMTASADAVVESHSHPDVRSGGPNVDPIRTLDPNSKIDSVVALASEAIRFADQKKRS